MFNPFNLVGNIIFGIIISAMLTNFLLFPALADPAFALKEGWAFFERLQGALFILGVEI